MIHRALGEIASEHGGYRKGGSDVKVSSTQTEAKFNSMGSSAWISFNQYKLSILPFPYILIFIKIVYLRILWSSYYWRNTEKKP